MAIAATYKEKVFHVGDTVRVHQKVKEADGKTRIQFFDGIVISIKGQQERKSTTVRRIGSGRIGIEKIFPLATPTIEKIEVLSRGASRKAKLYYLREKPPKEIAELGGRYARRNKASSLSEAKVKSGTKKSTKRGKNRGKRGGSISSK